VPASSIKNPQLVSDVQKAQLNAMGVSLYEPIKSIQLEGQPWLNDVCKLLKITSESCFFDSIKPRFDDSAQTLHLPSMSYTSEAELKKSIWLSIRQFVT
jgi:hypothetical protein